MAVRRKFDQAFWASPIHQEVKMSQETRKIRFGLWYDFRNPAQWRQPADRLYREILDQIAWGENNGFDDVWLSEHHLRSCAGSACLT
jgi:hypothetical protein